MHDMHAAHNWHTSDTLPSKMMHRRSYSRLADVVRVVIPLDGVFRGSYSIIA
jgi:hypothetical protein